MDIKFNNDMKESHNQEPYSDKPRKSVLLFALLIVLGGFGYIYFFTDLIRSQEEQKPAEATVSQAVKKALPSREGTTPAVAQSETKQEQVAPAKQKPAKAPQADAAVPASVKEASKPSEDSKKPPLQNRQRINLCRWL